jgi:hypothetical protein
VLVERALKSASDVVAGAEAPVKVLSRVQEDMVAAIAETVQDNQITTVILGADTRFGGNRYLLKSMIDRLANKTDAEVMAARLNEPAMAPKRMLAVLPGGAELNEGFVDAVRDVKSLAKAMKAPLTFVTVRGSEESLSAIVRSVSPKIDFETIKVDGWWRLGHGEAAPLRSDDFLFILRPRYGTEGWSDVLTSFPARSVMQDQASFVILYLKGKKTRYVRPAPIGLYR